MTTAELTQVRRFYERQEVKHRAALVKRDVSYRDATKVCTKCGLEKSLTRHFYRNVNSSDGRSAQCKKCMYQPIPKDQQKPKGNFKGQGAGRKRGERAVLVEEAAELRLKGWRYDRIARALGIGADAASWYAYEGGGHVSYTKCPAGEAELEAWIAERERLGRQQHKKTLAELRSAKQEGRLPSWHVQRPAAEEVAETRQAQIDALTTAQAKDMKWADKADFVNAKWRYSLDAPIKRMVDNEPIETTYLELLQAPPEADPQQAMERNELNELLGGLDEQAVERMNEETLEHYRDKLREAGYSGRGVPTSERERLKTIEPHSGISGRPERLEIPADDLEGDLVPREHGSKKDRVQRRQLRKAIGDHDQKRLARNRRGLRPAHHVEARRKLQLGGMAYPIGKGGRTRKHLSRRQERELDRIWMVMDGWMIAEGEVV